MLHSVRWNTYLMPVVIVLFLLPASAGFGQSGASGPLPPLTADLALTYASDPTPSAFTSHYARNASQERWETYGMVTVQDYALQETKIWNDNTQTFSIVPWNWGANQAQSQMMASQTTPPPPLSQTQAASAACPTNPGGWSLAPPPTPHPAYASASAQQLN